VLRKCKANNCCSFAGNSVANILTIFPHRKCIRFELPVIYGLPVCSLLALTPGVFCKKSGYQQQGYPCIVPAEDHGGYCHWLVIAALL
jgi:hypothetical protein